MNWRESTPNCLLPLSQVRHTAKTLLSAASKVTMQCCIQTGAASLDMHFAAAQQARLLVLREHIMYRVLCTGRKEKEREKENRLLEQRARRA